MTSHHGARTWITATTSGCRTAVLLVTIAATVDLVIPAFARADHAPPCVSGQVTVSNGGHRERTGHREVMLTFSLAPGADPCTLTGYPGVDTGAGGPLIHAQPTPSGFLGGLPDPALPPPTVTLSDSQPAMAVVEGVAVDRLDVDRKCPTYNELQVTPPETEDAVIVASSLETCELQVHPVGSDS